MKAHVLTPFYRKHLTKTLIAYFEKMDIIWHPICDPTDIEPFKDNTRDWIQPLLCSPLVPTDQCYRKFNDFINAGQIVDEDYYCFSGDDDMFEPGFFDVVRQQTSKILINSN